MSALVADPSLPSPYTAAFGMADAADGDGALEQKGNGKGKSRRERRRRTQQRRRLSYLKSQVPEDSDCIIMPVAAELQPTDGESDSSDAVVIPVAPASRQSGKQQGGKGRKASSSSSGPLGCGLDPYVPQMHVTPYDASAGMGSSTGGGWYNGHAAAPPPARHAPSTPAAQKGFHASGGSGAAGVRAAAFGGRSSGMPHNDFGFGMSDLLQGLLEVAPAAAAAAAAPQEKKLLLSLGGAAAAVEAAPVPETQMLETLRDECPSTAACVGFLFDDESSPRCAVRATAAPEATLKRGWHNGAAAAAIPAANLEPTISVTLPASTLKTSLRTGGKVAGGARPTVQFSFDVVQ